MSKSIKTQENIVAKVKAVRYFEKDGKTSVQVTFDKSFKGYRKNEDTGDYEEKDVNTLSLPAGLLIDHANGHDVAAYFVATSDDVMSHRVLGILAMGASFKLSFVHHDKGDEVDGETLGRDQWFTTTSDYKPSEMSLKLMEKAIGF